MASPTENSNRSSSSKKPHLLKPCLTSINESQAHLCQKRSAPSPDLEALSTSVTFWGWRYPHNKFNSWARKMSALHEPIWRKAGIFEAILASTYKILKNTDLVMGIAEKWCPDTNTFVFSWGEATITLEDVMVLLGFSVLGSPVFATLDSSGKEIMAKLGKEWLKIKKDKGTFVTQIAWIERFMDSGDELEHLAFLVLWLSYFVFPTRYYHIYEAIWPIAIHLSNGTKMALAPAVLAHLYADLSLLKNHITALSESPIKVEIDLSSLCKLVNVWIWERFRALQSKPNLLLKGEPRLALWNDLKQRTSNAKRILNNSKIDGFEWCPYTKTVKNWDFLQFYPEKATWVTLVPNRDDEFISFARCIMVSQLVGIDSLEHYYPNRVASQFGRLQDVHCPVNRNNLSREAAWNDYYKPLDDLELYIPSRSAISCDTPMFCDSWRKRVVGSAKTLRTSIGDDTSFVPSGSKMNRRSEDGRKIAEDSTKKRLKFMKSARKNDGSTMGQKQVISDDADDDDSLTVAQITTLYKKKYSENSGGNASEPLGKKIRLEADNNGLEPCQKLSSIRYDGDETVPPPEIKKRNEETGSKSGMRVVLSPFDESNSSKPPVDFGRAIDIVVSAPETMTFCDDVYGNNAEKKTMIDDDSEELKCLLHEDGTITREMARSDKKCCSEAEKEDADGGISDKVLASKADNKKSIPYQKLASGCANGDETSKAYKPKVLKRSDGNQAHACLLPDDGIRSEETMKSNEQLKVFEKRNNDLGEGDVDNDTTEKRSQKLNVLALSIEERVLKAERTVAWLNQRRAIKQRKVAAAGLS